MEYTYLHTETLLENLIKLVLPSHTTEDLAERAFAFREKNWTSQGTYAYVKYSSFTKEQQDEMRELLMSNVSIDEKFFDEIYPEYDSLLRDEITTEWDLTEELEGVEIDSDEYYNIIDECVESTTEINSPRFHFILACIELMEESASNLFNDEGLQTEIDDLVSKNGLIDDYGYIYNADNDEDDDENDVNYTIEFDYDKMENVIYDNHNQEIITLDELEKRIEKVKVSLAY